MRDPAVLLYTKDFLSGTAFFNDTERGQYIRLLCEQHQNGHIPENHMLSVCLSLASPVVKKFTKDSDGNYFNERMELEIEKRNKFTESRANNGKLGGRPRKDKKPIDKPSAKPKGKASKNLVADANGIVIKYDFVLPEYEEVFNIWLQYKKEIKDEYKAERSIKSFYKSLVELSENNPEIAMKIVDRSIANNWKGIFALPPNFKIQMSNKPKEKSVQYKMYGQIYIHAEKAYLDNIKSCGAENIQLIKYID